MNDDELLKLLMDVWHRETSADEAFAQISCELRECREKNLWLCNENLKMKKRMAAMPNVES